MVKKNQTERTRLFVFFFFFAPVPSQEFLASACLVSFSLSAYLCVAGVYRSNYFACFGANSACPVVWGFPPHSLKTHGWPWTDIFHPSGVIVSLTYSPHLFSWLDCLWDLFLNNNWKWICWSLFFTCLNHLLSNFE